MALIDPDAIVRLDIPHEPGEWVDVRPTTIGDIEAAQKSEANGNVTLRLALLERVIVGWSYRKPPSPEALRALDPKTFTWLDSAAYTASGLREQEEKKASNGNSSPSTEQDGASSPVSSAT